MAVLVVEDLAVEKLVAGIVWSLGLLLAVLSNWIWHLVVGMMAVFAVENFSALACPWNISARGVLFGVVGCC